MVFPSVPNVWRPIQMPQTRAKAPEATIGMNVLVFICQGVNAYLAVALA